MPRGLILSVGQDVLLFRLTVSWRLRWLESFGTARQTTLHRSSKALEFPRFSPPPSATALPTFRVAGSCFVAPLALMMYAAIEHHDNHATGFQHGNGNGDLPESPDSPSDYDSAGEDGDSSRKRKRPMNVTYVCLLHSCERRWPGLPNSLR
jgi:hypothetical protein